MTFPLNTAAGQSWFVAEPACRPLEGKHTLFAGKTVCECGAVKLVNATLAPPVTFHHSLAAKLG